MVRPFRVRSPVSRPPPAGGVTGTLAYLPQPPPRDRAEHFLCTVKVLGRCMWIWSDVGLSECKNHQEDIGTSTTPWSLRVGNQRGPRSPPRLRALQKVHQQLLPQLRPTALQPRQLKVQLTASFSLWLQCVPASAWEALSCFPPSAYVQILTPSDCLRCSSLPPRRARLVPSELRRHVSSPLVTASCWRAAVTFRLATHFCEGPRATRAHTAAA